MAIPQPEDWQPVARVAQLDRRPILAVQVFGQYFVLFRTKQGNLGLILDGCAHLGVTLEPGWVEADRIRCGYHGWAYDIAGRCIDIPGDSSDWKDRFRLPAYPAREAGGIVWAYGGTEDEPELCPLEELLRVHGAAVPDSEAGDKPPRYENGAGVPD